MEEGVAFAGCQHARTGSQDLLLLGLGFEQDLGGESRTERTFIFMMRSETVGASTGVGKALAANFKASELGDILASCAGFIIKSINSKALYDCHAEFLSIGQVVIAVCKGVLIVIVAKDMVGFEMSTRGWNKVCGHARQDLSEEENCERGIVRK